MKHCFLMIAVCCAVTVQAQKLSKPVCEPVLSRAGVDSLIQLTVRLRAIDTSAMLFIKPDPLDFTNKDEAVLTRYIKPKIITPYHAWAGLDSADVAYMVCTRKQFKNLEWKAGQLGFNHSGVPHAICFSFPYRNASGNIVIVACNYYNWYENEGKYIYDGGYLLALLREGDTWRVEELVKSIR